MARFIGDRFLALTQTTDFFPFVGYFSPSGAKNNLQKKESTMLPQARIAFAEVLILYRAESGGRTKRSRAHSADQR
jgi:hypothetical protein